MMPNELQDRAAYDVVFQNGTVFLGGSDSVYTAGTPCIRGRPHGLSDLLILFIENPVLNASCSGSICIKSLPTVARTTMTT
jgi:hypothetical protein